jgi:hypothetical protein
VSQSETGGLFGASGRRGITMAAAGTAHQASKGLTRNQPTPGLVPSAVLDAMLLLVTVRLEGGSSGNRCRWAAMVGVVASPLDRQTCWVMEKGV